MRHPSPESAPHADLNTTTPSAPARRNGKDISHFSLIDALKNSATRNDQIIQCRIGTRTEPDDISKKSRKVERNSGPEE